MSSKYKKNIKNRLNNRNAKTNDISSSKENVISSSITEITYIPDIKEKVSPKKRNEILNKYKWALFEIERTIVEVMKSYDVDWDDNKILKVIKAIIPFYHNKYHLIYNPLKIIRKWRVEEKDLYLEIHVICEQLLIGLNLFDKYLECSALYDCLNVIIDSINFWTERDGPKGYVNYIDMVFNEILEEENLESDDDFEEEYKGSFDDSDALFSPFINENNVFPGPSDFIDDFEKLEQFHDSILLMDLKGGISDVLEHFSIEKGRVVGFQKRKIKDYANQLSHFILDGFRLLRNRLFALDVSDKEFSRKLSDELPKVIDLEDIKYVFPNMKKTNQIYLLKKIRDYLKYF